MISNRLATAEWADPFVVAENYQFEEGEFWLGRGADENTAPVGYIDDRHICLVSGSRGGKGTSVIINNLCLYPGSLVVIDPKGENATVTAARRGAGSEFCEGMGQNVHVLDPFNAAQVSETYKSCFNPLDALDPNNEESIDEAGRIADALIVINPESKDPFWDESARSMVKGILLHVLTADGFDGRRNLITVRELITRGDWQSVELLKEAGEENIASGQALLWEGIRNNMMFGGIIAGIGETFGNMAVNSPKQFESVLQVANRNTEFIDSPGMRKCLSVSDFKLSDLKTKHEGVSIYLSLPQRYMNTHYRWLRMMIALTITEMEKVKGKPATGHRVLMCLDEFAGLKRMEIIENAVAQIAGFGVTLFFVLQSLEQLKAAYKDNWETFLSNSGLKVFFNLEDHFSREYVSKFVGDTEIIREVRSSSRSESESESQSHSTSYSTSKSKSRSTSNSYSRSQSRSGGTSQSRSGGKSQSRSGGTNQSKNRSTGSSDGMSWKRRWALLPFRKDKQYNEGSNKSEGTSNGTNQGWSDGTNQGWSDGTNQGWSDGTSRSKSKTYGTSTSETYGTSDSTTYGTSHSSTEGTSETVHRRPLIYPDELGKFFGRINSKDHPAYPGLALILVAGENPIVVGRVNYYEEDYFAGLYDPHPEHGLLDSSISREIPIIPLLNLTPPQLSSSEFTVKWLVKQKEQIQKNQLIAELSGISDEFPSLELENATEFIEDVFTTSSEKLKKIAIFFRKFVKSDEFIMSKIVQLINIRVSQLTTIKVYASESGKLDQLALESGDKLEQNSKSIGIIKASKRQTAQEIHIPFQLPELEKSYKLESTAFYHELSTSVLLITTFFLIFQVFGAFLFLSSSLWMLIPYIFFSLLLIYIYIRIAIIYNFLPPPEFYSEKSENLEWIKKLYNLISIVIPYLGLGILCLIPLFCFFLIIVCFSAVFIGLDESLGKTSLLIRLILSVIVVSGSVYLVPIMLSKFIPPNERNKDVPSAF